MKGRSEAVTMCKSKRDGGQRCYPHAKEAYEKARENLVAAEKSLDSARLYVAPHDGSMSSYRIAQRQQMARLSEATRHLSKATTAYEKATAAYVNTDQGRADVIEKINEADRAGNKKAARRYRLEYHFGAQAREQERKIKQARTENAKFMVKGARLVPVTNPSAVSKKEPIAHVVVGPVEENSPFEARPVAYKGKHVATLDKYERTRNLASQGTVWRVDGGDYTVWTVSFPGQRHEHEFDTRNKALVAIVHHADEAEEQHG